MAAHMSIDNTATIGRAGETMHAYVRSESSDNRSASTFFAGKSYPGKDTRLKKHTCNTDERTTSADVNVNSTRAKPAHPVNGNVRLR